jgi:hypothetical protein
MVSGLTFDASKAMSKVRPDPDLLDPDLLDPDLLDPDLLDPDLLDPETGRNSVKKQYFMVKLAAQT